MRKIKVEYDVSTPEGMESFHCALNGSSYRRALEEIKSELRKLDKYGDKREYDISEIRNIISSIIVEYADFLD